jgi:exo-beta-1,3-glucanase (GH17 family)
VFETGWPTGGKRKGQAVPSVENQKRYNREVAAWAQKESVDVYFFQLIDEPWKAEIEGHDYEGTWGWRHDDGTPKY